MEIVIRPLPAGLYFVATPIGAARDITLRALDTLASADVLAAEDTRSMRRLMDIHGVELAGRPLFAYHDHNGAVQRPKLLAALSEGKSVAYASEAGTPLVADPGFALAREALEAGYMVTSAPGPSAAIDALTISGLPSDRFFFAGFAPPAAGARTRFLNELKEIPGTLILYESPKRVEKLLAALVQCFGAKREAAVCRELTKKFEEVKRGTLEDLATKYRGQSVKGEIVVLVDRRRGSAATTEEMEAALREALLTLSVKDAASVVAAQLDLPKRAVYQAALRLSADQ